MKPGAQVAEPCASNVREGHTAASALVVSDTQITQLSPAFLAYSIPALSIVTSISRALIYKNIAQNRLKITKVGRRTVVLREDAEAWLRQLRNPHDSSEDVTQTGKSPTVKG